MMSRTVRVCGFHFSIFMAQCYYCCCSRSTVLIISLQFNVDDATWFELPSSRDYFFFKFNNLVIVLRAVHMLLLPTCDDSNLIKR